MIAGAALLGVVSGACTGYVIQAGRAPTALPPLSQPVVAQAGGEVEPLSAAQDRRVRTDGDLRKLLITRPRGAKDKGTETERDGWADLFTYASGAYLHAGDVLALVLQSHKGAAAAVPFQQTVALQSQLLS